MNILIIGGTRNLGHLMVHALLERGHHMTVLNRGISPDDLPPGVQRLKADRADALALADALRGRTFDVVIDNALFKGEEAETAIKLLQGRVGRYLFLSSGQVYLVREGSPRPSVESDYAGRLMPSPKPDTYHYAEWRYGIEKREVEDAMAAAYAAKGFPFTSLRLPMVNSERDPFLRLYNYMLRLKDGGGILAPETPNFALRHIYGPDVVAALLRILDSGVGVGQAYNIAQDETVLLDDFLAMLAERLGVAARIVRVLMSKLEAQGFLPDCSPFSERWMSKLDNSLSKAAFGMAYTPLAVALDRLVAHYEANPPREPASYKRRRAEITYMKMAESESTPS